ncbi:MAG: tRNA preQ1(34) S-adenosylmethionine ribosyltransferase-isomerase QueA [Verrucomicrobia bacterium]|nr:tRNA preQ1(34) S-adenosylmethionine ribosyltransferase-isomerase QueA [Verrucomicrobiota bacterium]MCH8513828.1 tRNA preQ1(34) S-adenosylmethionine ribosyltransferase-isomerase QueA [Kiritimatiellia bacterium]
MQTAEFDYHLPEHLIAQHPADRRDAARMLCMDRATGAIQHRGIRDLPGLLRAGDALVLNNTRVIPARTHGHKPSGGKVECLFVEPVDGSDDEWLVMMKSSRRPKTGSEVHLPADLVLEILENRSDGLNRVRTSGPDSVLATLREIGEPPLPPYIHREHLCEDDPERYQTVYAKTPGAVAAPTAGLHFTPELLDEIRANGVEIVEVTLHVGPGTFRPVKTETVEAHHMDEERYEISEAAAETLNRVRSKGGRIVAVGSTSARTLETVADAQGHIVAGRGRSGIYIHPPYTFRGVDAILTNFHLPRSTLLMMMSAFSSREFLLQAYKEAVKEEYRFFSYGDCMFIS